MISQPLIVGLSILGSLSPAAALTTNLNGTYHKYSAATYNLVQSYTSANFFSSFTFFTGSDPTHGFVNYQSQANAVSKGLANTNNGQIYLGVDHTTVNPSSPGRASTRVSSNAAFTHGLFIADIAHMPGNDCGVWPAWWLVGGNWPNGGEIDAIEGVSLATQDTITLHTAAGCNINTAGSQPGTTLASSNCNSNNANDGCTTSNTVPNAYGNAFNNNGGGVYVIQWESSGIYIWFFPRNAIPADITAGRPQTSGWGLPVVAFNGGSGCNIDQYFSAESIVFDTTFCGDWAGSVFSSGSCGSLASSCQNYVAQNPSAFKDSYWLINSVRVFHQ